MEVGEINKAAVRRRGLHYEVILRGFIRRENESAANAPLLYTYHVLIYSRRRGENRKAGFRLPFINYNHVLFSPLREITFLINGPVLVPFEANIQMPGDMSTLGSEGQLSP